MVVGMQRTVVLGGEVSVAQSVLVSEFLVLSEHLLAVVGLSVGHVVGIALSLSHAVDVPSASADRHLVLGQVVHVLHGSLVGVDTVTATCEYQLGVLGGVELAVEQRAVRLKRVDVCPSVGEVLAGVRLAGRRSDGERVVLVTARLLLGHGVEVVHASLVGIVYEVAACGCGLCPLLLVVLLRYELLATLIHEVGKLGVAVVERTCGIYQHLGAHCQGCALGRAHDVGVVALLGQVFGSEQHLLGHVVYALVHGAARYGQLIVRLGVVGTLVGHDGHGAIAAHEQPVEVGAEEACLSLQHRYLLLGLQVVGVSLVYEHRCLAYAVVCPGP